ncbi:MAG: chromosome segregation protein SMC [Chloroflexi bacterium]|nr:chromosome segregation protein SMC [Chloroflexota bacterium]
MRLKRLELRGFKTFANPITLEFVSPVTAVVGPNGSGKSNVADAVRWVLGEQNARALRTKRTEDVIFAGGNGRSQLGMAEVALTLDNEDGSLGLPQAEVCLSRRAFRSGENEYLLNGARARLRDLNGLVLKAGLGPSGYTVIGQGMVDLALSLRPEERRALFEEAADVKRHYLKIREARDRLAATEENVQRVVDLAAELAPRVSTLERQAERARRHEALSAELKALLSRHYRLRWHRSQAQLARLEAREAEAAAHLAAVQAEAAAQSDRAAAVGERRAEIGRALATLAAELAPLGRELERVTLELAVGREREAALAARQAELATRRQVLAESASRAQEQQAAAVESYLAARMETARLLASLASLDESAESARALRESCQSKLAVCLAEAERLTEAWAQTRASLARLVERGAALARDREAQLAALRDAERGLAESDRELAEGSVALAGLDESLRALAAEREGNASQATAAEAEVVAAQHRLEEAGRERQVLEARLNVLERWRHDLSGYHAGARAVLQASRSPRGERLSGVVGLVASLLRVPPELETAVEVALGGRLQDLVVERWRDAEAAIEYLKRTHAGRATFLPLETIRATPAGNPVPGQGVLGLGCELVQCDPAHAGVARHLLGRTIIVQDLPVARRVLGSCPQGWQIVTLAGELVRTNGAVTGGSLAPQQGGLLGQERELRDLPERLRALATAHSLAERQLAERREALRELRSTAARLAEQARALEGRRQQEEANRQAGRREVERLRREVARLRQSLQAAEKDAAGHATREAATRNELSRLEREREQARLAGEAARAALAAAEAAGGDSLRRLAEVRAGLAAAEREEARLGAEQAERQGELARLAEGEARLLAEAQEGRAQAAELAAALGEFAGRAPELAAQREQLAGREAELHRSLAALERELAALESLRQATQRRLAEAMAGEGASAAAVQRARGELAALRERIGGDLGLEQDERTRQLRLPWEDEPQAPAGEDYDPEQLRRQIDQLRAQLRSLPAFNPTAVQDYEELAARHTFLTAQEADLRQAGRALQQAITDLEKAMRKQFERTFVAVAAEFRRYFTLLFGGGTARLTLTDPHSLLQTGVDIVAQPPGKRSQNLTLLSGGERALTAVALLFALLSVKPAPFCVLDEVDAALDDSNVARCLSVIADLSRQTQFIVITHNRVTMEAAGALYGVTIGRDGVSRVVSLRLEEATATAV